MVTIQPDTFTGFYEPVEAARIVSTDLKRHDALHFDSRKALRWIRAGLTDKDLIGIHGRKLMLGFEDLVSMRVIAALRAHGVSFPKIYTAERWLRKTTEHIRPFATEQLWTESNEVFSDFSEHLVTASKNGQIAMDFIRENLIPVHGLTFDDKHIATTWEPRTGITLDPEKQFGQSCIKGTRIPTKTISSMYSAGDSIEFIAETYWLSSDEVSAAIAWENELAA